MVQFGANIEVKDDHEYDEKQDINVNPQTFDVDTNQKSEAKKKKYERELSQRQEEKREYEDVSWSVYLAYFRAAGSNILLVTLVCLFLLVQVINNLGDWWLREW